MQDFYESFYKVADQSAAYAEFCLRAFGENLCQHGFADMQQLDVLIIGLRLDSKSTALDMGCGNGMIAEYISDRTRATLTGLDYNKQAIEQAKKRTAAKSERLNFVVGDINALQLPRQAYDAILSIDSIYFSTDYTAAIGNMASALRPGGQLGILYSYGREPWVAKEEFPVECLPPDRTPLAVALTANGLAFHSEDFTRRDYENAQRRKELLNELHPQFEAEGIEFIWQNRMGEAMGIAQAIEDRLHVRYLYLARRSTLAR